jgi:hypothetical protein
MRKNHYLLALALGAGAAIASASGCELIASVDRTLIPATGGTGGGIGGTGGAGGAPTTTGGGQGGQGGTGTGGSDCSDGAQNGSETDVDCGGSCPPCALGKTCAAGTDCDSAFCASGVCCDTACDGTCEACSAATKESGADDGTCGTAKSGSACGDTQGCANGVETVADLCDAAGTCVDGSTNDCAPYTCDLAGITCLTMCTSSTDCVGTHFCNMQMVCTPKLADGQSCQGPDECTSGNCVDGVCCSSATCGDCQACNLNANGTCSNVPAGTPDPPTCSGTTACDGMGACLAANGQTCAGPAECASAFCVDTVCCGTACTGPCKVCNSAGTEGTCGNAPQGTLDPLCTGLNTTCNNAGVCKLPGGGNCGTGADCASGSCALGVCTNP